MAAVPQHPGVHVVLGLALKEVRTARRITQEELSRRTGVHPTYISDIERGARNPSWDAVVKLADGLEAPMAELAAAFDRVRLRS